MKYFVPVFILLFLLGVGIYQVSQPVSYGFQPEQFLDHKTLATKPDAGNVNLSTSSKQPNFIIILADDLGYGDVGAYGNKIINTPNLDRLAKEGMTFTSAYASAPLCSPSRAGLLTGRYPLRSGIVQPVQAAGDSFARQASYQAGMAIANLASIDMLGGSNMVKGLPESEITIAETLHAAGYKTGIYGKWHLGDFTEWPKYHPHNHGFDDFVGFNMSNDDWPVAFYRNAEKQIEDIGLEQSEYTGLFTNEAIRFIKESADSPFFVYLSHKDPHQPFYPSEKFAGKSRAGPYGDAVSEFDWSIGEIKKTLVELGLSENTLIIVTSDNGPWYEGSAGNLRGRKGQSYEGGFRVPMVASWPGRVAAGGQSDIPVMNIDFFTTFNKLAGIALPSDRTIDGQDLSPLLFQGTHQLADRALYFFHDYDLEAIRKGSWKFISQMSHWVWPVPLDKQDSLGGMATSNRNYTPPGGTVAVPTLGKWPLLYDLSIDEQEAYNLADHNPDKVAELQIELTSWREKFYADPRQIQTITTHSTTGK